ncbi:hypothetical protein BC828DRAFT_438275 [Blastocladiella britannica]|nr:hypothetical protein BC828DRAFT_438275 [Blastocladiella britannica]
MTTPASGRQCPELKAVATALKVPIDLTPPDCCKWNSVLCNDYGNVTKIIWNVKGAPGYIPDVIQNLTSLEYLSLQHNVITGTLPSGLGQLSKLIYLSVYDNHMEGEIPETLGLLQNLQVMYVYPSDPFFSFLFSTSLLTPHGTSDLSSNNLTGSIPASLNNLTRLQEIYLDDNQLTGGIPDLYTSHLCFGGTNRTGICYDQFTRNGIKDCNPLPPPPANATIAPPNGSASVVIPAVAGGAGFAVLVMAVVIGVLVHRLRQAKEAAAAAGATSGQSFLSPTVSTGMDSATITGIYCDLPADDSLRRPFALPSSGTAGSPTPASMDVVDGNSTLTSRILPDGKRILVDLNASTDTGSTIASRTLPTAGRFLMGRMASDMNSSLASSRILPTSSHHPSTVMSSIDSYASSTGSMASSRTSHADVDSDIVVLHSGPIVGYDFEEHVGASRRLL